MTAALSSWALDPRTMSYADMGAYTVALLVTVAAFAVLVVLGLATPRRCAVWALLLVVGTFGLVGMESAPGPVPAGDGVEAGL